MYITKTIYKESLGYPNTTTDTNRDQKDTSTFNAHYYSRNKKTTIGVANVAISCKDLHHGTDVESKDKIEYCSRSA